MKVSGLFFAMVVIAFLLPFVVVSCGETELISVSGYKLATGFEISNPLDSDDNVDVEPKAFAVISILMAVVGLIAAFRLDSRKYIVLVILAAIGFISLLLLKMDMRVDNSESMDEYADMITAKWKIGYYLSLLGFLLAFISELIPKYRHRKLRNVQDFKALFDKQSSTDENVWPPNPPTGAGTMNYENYEDAQDNAEDSPTPDDR